MKILFAYYSFEGNCRTLAEAMAKATGGDLHEIRPVKDDMPRAGFMKLYVGGKSSIKKEAPEIHPHSFNIRDYDLIFAGGPVWAWNMAPPVRTFLQGEDWNGLRVALFAMSGGPAGATFPAMRAVVEAGGGTVVDTARYTDLRKGDGEKTVASAVAWCRGVIANQTESGT